MKALVLAAGFGTRLRPYTRSVPKPLFTIASTPVLGRIIESLIDCGCDKIWVNTHHLPDQIEAFLSQQSYPVPVQTLYEPIILDTGGAIANARPLLEDAPFFVINSDIVTNIDLKKVFDFHQASDSLATLVLHDDSRFNKVGVDSNGRIRDFNADPGGLAFTGIQVLSPEIYRHFPEEKIFSSIQVYKALAAENKIKAQIETDIFWSDIGTPDAYSQTSRLMLAAACFQTDDPARIHIEKLAGDGSDRLWFRARENGRSLVLCDHGICLPESDERSQMDAFVRIGGHLKKNGVPVPAIYLHDSFAGAAVMEDLGDQNLETEVKLSKSRDQVFHRYQEVIRQLIDFSRKGVQGFDRQWTCQTETYSQELILEKECRYFMDAFVRGYQNRDVRFEDFEPDFRYAAEQALQYGYNGLMHRDFQSRNIMIYQDRPYFIDFQSARIGPLQYDLASLLIDPYVCLDMDMQADLLAYAADRIGLEGLPRHQFFKSFQYCCLTRNLQILGAFSFLSRVKKKLGFEQYIPDAVNSLKRIVHRLDADRIKTLSGLIRDL